MRRGVFVVSLLVFFVSSMVLASAADVAYIYKKSFKIDNNVISTFENAGLSVELIQENQLPVNWNNYGMIFVGDEVFTNTNLIPVNDFPTIVSNYYHTNFWGLTDGDGASQLSSNTPLRVFTFGQEEVQVYTQATTGTPGTALSYYYLSMNNRAPSMQTVALTQQTSSGYNFGDVISYARVGDQMLNGRTQNSKLCFYGIIRSNYWTPAARDMLRECASFVISSCLANSDCPSPKIVGEPFCQGGNVHRIQTSYTCQNGEINSQCVESNSSVIVEECQFGCENGSCVQPTCLQNADCGTDGFVGNEFCSAGGDVVKNFRSWTCNNPGTSQSYCSFSDSQSVVEECSDVCLNGSCMNIVCHANSDCDDNNPLTFDECINPGSVVSQCTNTPINCASNLDCGSTGFVGNEFCSADNVMKNFQNATCVNAGTTNSFCNVHVSPQQVNSCEFACFDGSCISCNENTDCDDGNSNTADICVNPGSVESFCKHETITCSQNSDCGTDGIFGDNFCSESGDLSEIFRSWTCNSPGTSQSFCSFSDEEILKEECSAGCSEGNCQEIIACSNNNDCDDNNPLTFDECINPGSVVSQCTNTPINCASNLDCGSTGFVGNEFCSADDVMKNFQNATCVNAGTTNSFCNVHVSPQQVNSCEFACFDGSCISCNENTDCDDGNSNTADICVNPGSVESFCSNPLIADGEITCNQNVDCGESVVMSGNFCSVSDVNQLVMTWTCNNPGTTISYCSSNIVVETLETCSGMCSSGMCFDVECFNNADCGTDGFVGNEFCSAGGNVVKNFVTNICNNPGTQNSFCSSDLEEVTVEMCVEDCENGVCVEFPECAPGDMRECGTSSVGVCELGTQMCSAQGTWENCVGAVEPTDEICDGLDNNCNGKTDEGEVCQPSCTNQCTNGATMCVNADGYKICGDFNNDGCSEWSAGIVSCGFGSSCVSGQCS